MKNVLIIEDDESMQFGYNLALYGGDLNVIKALTFKKAKEILESEIDDLDIISFIEILIDFIAELLLSVNSNPNSIE